MKCFLRSGLLGLVVLVSGCTGQPELVWNDADGYRWAELPAFNGTTAGFEEVSSSKTGVTFVNTLEESSLIQNRHFMNGSGVALGDVDGDGWTDIYFARLDGPNVLYRNLGGWRFEDVTEAAGVAAPDRYSTGAVFADIDGDGDLDLLVTAMDGPNAVFLNDGTGRFTEVTEEVGLASMLGSTSMALADVDGDGDLDLFVANYKARSVNDIYPPWEHSFERTVIRDGDSLRIAPQFQEHYTLRMHAGGLLREERAEPNSLYLNDGSGRFTPVSFPDGVFYDASGQPLSEAPEDWTLTIRFQDVNGDGVPDLYVCNDFQSPDRFWINDGSGRFHPVGPLAVRKTSFSTMSVDFSDINRDGNLDFFLTDMLSRDYARRQTQVGLTIPMTTAAGEIDNQPQAVQNTLFLNRGDGTYAEIGRLSGVAASDWTWSGLFLDVDLDGFEDIVLATGHVYDVIDKDAQMREMLNATRQADAFRREILEFPQLPLKNVAFRNVDGLRFEHVPDGWGLGKYPDVSNALAFADLDNDGDLDVIVNRLNDTAGLFRNRAGRPRLAVRLLGTPPNTQAIGSKIRVTAEGLPPQEKEVVSGGIYLSGSDPLYTFAAVDSPMAVEILWRNGETTRLDGIEPNRILEIFEPGRPNDNRANDPDTDTSTASPAESNVLATASDPTLTESLVAPTDSSPGDNTTAEAAIFQDVSMQLGHTHVESEFDDFERMPLLRRGLSRTGPGIAWVDIDRDGRDELLVGTGRGGRIALFRSTPQGRFTPVEDDLLGEVAPDDVTGIVAAALPGGGARVFAGISSYEGSLSDSSWIRIIDLDVSGRPTRRIDLPFGRSSVGPLALADLDGDGDLDLFAGGRMLPGYYPGAADSRIFVNDGDTYHYDPELSRPFQEVGMVSGVALGDIDGDGDADIVLALQWGPIRIFENDGAGGFTDRADALGFGAYSGWWNGISLADFDGDGRLDILATNWGWNGVHERIHAAEYPVRLYAEDFDSDGLIDFIEAAYEPSLGAYVPMNDLTDLSSAMPYVRQRTPTHHQFATSTLRDVMGFKLDRAPFLEANTLSHMLFLNRNGQFEASVLPIEAQFAPAFAATVADFNADGHKDVFLSQNFFALSMEIPRQDAGRGLLLLGDGSGGFAAVPGSGVAAYGEQRGAAAADFDADGRIDLVVTQNGAETKLYRNTGKARGIRIRIEGPPTNPDGIGSVVRLRYSDGSFGPAHLVSAGSSYLSQQSATIVMGMLDGQEASSVEITWPDGSRTETALSNQTEVTVKR